MIAQHHPGDLDQLPPHSIEAEQGVIGCILLSPLEGLEYCAASNVQPECFYDGKHRTIYEALVRLCMAAKAIDTITLGQHLRDRKELDQAGGIAYISELQDKVPSTQTITYYLPILLEKDVARKTIRLCFQTSQSAYQTTSEHWLTDFRDKVISLRIGTTTEARNIGELIRPPENDPAAFFQNRYVCEAGGMLINGPTGMGKSSFTMQGTACWANCMEFFGIKPTKSLTSVIVQAENDDGDLAEMRDGICAGLQFNISQRQGFFNKVKVFRSNGTVGRRFCHEVIQPLLIQYRPNIIVIDPANSFIGGDTKEQKDVGMFLRTWLDPLLMAYKSMALIVHHTNKPLTGKEKPNWKNGEWAYAGSGSAEWANWPRAVLSIQDTGTHGVYRLHAGKRGKRLGWKDGNDQFTTERLIGHGKEHIYWREAEECELDETTQTKANPKDLLPFLSEKALTTTDWLKRSRQELNLPRATFFRHIQWLEKHEYASKFNNVWRPHQTS